MSDKTVLYINNFAGPGLGGGERHLGVLAAGAREAGWRVIIACVPGSDVGDWLRGRGHEVLDLNPSDPNVPKTLMQLRQIILREQAAIVHAHGFWPGIIARAAVRWPAGLNPRPVVITTVHCQPDSIAAGRPGGSAKAKLGLRRFLDNFTARWGDTFIAVSKDIAGQLTAQGIPTEQIVQIYNGVDVDELRSLAGSGVGSEKRSREIGTVARLEPVKGLDDLLQAFSLIADDFPESRLVIIGGGQMEAELKAKVRTSDLADRIELTGYLENPLPRVAQFEIYALASHSEGLNITFLEAMALRRPVIASDVGGNPELAEDGTTGYLAPSRDPGACAGLVKRVLSDSDERQKMGAAGAALVKDRFSAEAMVRQVLGLYDRLLSGAGPT